MGYITLKKRKKHNKLIMIALFNSVIIVFFLRTLNSKCENIIRLYSQNEVRSHSIGLVNQILKNVEIENADNLYKVISTSDDEIVTLDFNNKLVMDILEKINDNIRNTFSENKTIFLPYGFSSNNYFLNNLGPKIPILIKLTGNIFSQIKTDVVSYGINNALLKVYINIEITGILVFPMAAGSQKIVVDYPIITKIINGRVPSIYSGQISKNSILQES